MATTKFNSKIGLWLGIILFYIGAPVFVAGRVNVPGEGHRDQGGFGRIQKRSSETTESPSHSSRVKLIDHITKNYHNTIRPVYNTSTITNVTLRVTFHHLIDMDTRLQMFTLSIWVEENWRDEFISWDPSQFDGIESIYVPSDILWKPDITLYTNCSVDPDFSGYRPDPWSLIWYDGRIEWNSPAIINSYCTISVRHFPFDKQVCVLIYASWFYTDRQIQCKPELGPSAMQDRYVKNGVWDLQSVTVRHVSINYPCCADNFSEVHYHLTFRRHPEFYIIHVILPCMFLSALALLVFYLPPDCGEKLTLAITNLLALVVYQQIIAEHTPPSGNDSPIIDTFFLFLIVLLCVSVGGTVIVIQVASKTYPVNARLLKIASFLERAIFVHSNATHQHGSEDAGRVEPDRKQNFEVVKYRNNQEDVLYYVRMTSSGVETKSKSEDFSADWKRIAAVLDRILLICLFVCAFITTSAFAIKLYVETSKFQSDANNDDAVELIPS